MQAVFLNCKLKSFQLAQRKSVLRVAPAPRIFVVSVYSFLKSFSAHHPAKKIAESLMIPQNIVLRGRKKGEPFKDQIIEGTFRKECLYSLRGVCHK